MARDDREEFPRFGENPFLPDEYRSELERWDADEGEWMRSYPGAADAIAHSPRPECEIVGIHLASSCGVIQKPRPDDFHPRTIAGECQMNALPTIEIPEPIEILPPEPQYPEVITEYYERTKQLVRDGNWRALHGIGAEYACRLDSINGQLRIARRLLNRAIFGCIVLLLVVLALWASNLTR
jgi:hypothetical protein